MPSHSQDEKNYNNEPVPPEDKPVTDLLSKARDAERKKIEAEAQAPQILEELFLDPAYDGNPLETALKHGLPVRPLIEPSMAVSKEATRLDQDVSIGRRIRRTQSKNRRAGIEQSQRGKNRREERWKQKAQGIQKYRPALSLKDIAKLVHEWWEKEAIDDEDKRSLLTVYRHILKTCK